MIGVHGFGVPLGWGVPLPGSLGEMSRREFFWPGHILCGKTNALAKKLRPCPLSWVLSLVEGRPLSSLGGGLCFICILGPVLEGELFL